MKFVPTTLAGAFLIEVEPHIDQRGMFARTYCAKEFAAHGLIASFVQCNTSWNARRGTLRGMHHQLPPAAEVKLVRCTAGSIWDVIVDLRPNSSTYRQHFAAELSATNRRALYIPIGLAHGFQSLDDASEVFYQMGEFYNPALATGVRPDDPSLGIQWPLPLTAISERDREWPLL